MLNVKVFYSDLTKYPFSQKGEEKILTTQRNNDAKDIEEKELPNR